MNIKQRKGFTLIEILIVCAVIAVLAGITVLFSGPSRMKARDSRRLSDITQIQAALESYFAEQPRTNAKYPEQTDYGVVPEVLAPKHIAEVPSDPSGSDSPYKYMSISNGKGYCLAAKFEGVSPNTTVPTGCTAPTTGYNYIIRR